MTILSSTAGRFAVFFSIYYSFQALILIFFPLYIKDLGFSTLLIALITATENLATIVGPPTVLGGRLGRSPRFLVGCLIGALVFYLPLWRTTDPTVIFVTWFLCLVALKVTLVTTSAWAIQASNDEGFDFGRCRLWGSIGFVVASYLIALVVDNLGINQLVPLGTVLLVLMLLSGLVVKTKPRTTPSEREFSLRPSSWSRDVRQLFLVYSLAWGAHAIFFTYSSIHFQSIGLSARLIAIAWIISVVAEIAVWAQFRALERRYQLTQILAFSMVCSTLRWIVLAVSIEPSVILLSQLLHGGSFGAMYLAGLKLAQELFPGSEERGQALLSAVGPGLGVLLCRVFAGGLSVILPLMSLFWVAAGCSLIGYLVARRWNVVENKTV